MNSILKFYLPILSFLFLFNACKKDEPVEPLSTGTNAQATPSLDLGSKINTSFSGTILDESGQPISGVSITISGETALTDGSGNFFIPEVKVPEKLAFIKAEKNGYFTGSRSLPPVANAVNQIKITLLEKTIAGTVQSGENATISLNSGAAVDLEGAYVDASGNPYNGSVQVALKYLPALAAATRQQMPGMLYAENESGAGGVLETYGMLAVELIGEAGQELQIASGSQATLHVPVENSQLQSAPNSIPLWYFNEDVGYWVEEGSATLVNGEYVGNVDHFTFWNCDRFLESFIFEGFVNFVNGTAASGAEVNITAGANQTTGYASGSGYFHTYLPTNTLIHLEIVNACGGTPFSFQIGPFSSTANVSESFQISNDNSHEYLLSGELVDCNGDPLTDATVIFFSDNSLVSEHVTNGNFNTTFSTCNLQSSINIHVSNHQNSEHLSQNIPLNGNQNNLGQLTVCSTTGGGTGGGNNQQEYITYTINSGPQVTITQNVAFAYLDANNQTGFVLGDSLQQEVMIGSYNNTIGSYFMDDMNQDSSAVFIQFFNQDQNVNAPYWFASDILTNEGSGGLFKVSSIGAFSNSNGILVNYTLEAQAIIP